jgi:four helix bundle protein
MKNSSIQYLCFLFENWLMKYDLEDRLINFSVSIIKMVESVQTSKAGNHLSGQIVRSGTSVALNYGEAQSSESPKDFIHKMKVVLKELLETYIGLKILQKSNLVHTKIDIESIKDENFQLISIFSKSVKTAKNNMN